MKTGRIKNKLTNINKKKIRYRMIPFLIIACVLLFIALYQGIDEEIKMYLIFGVIFIGILVVAHVESKIGDLDEERHDIYNDALETMIDYPHYEPERGFTNIDVITFGIIKLGKIFNSENYFQGIYKGISARMADVVIYGDSNDEDDCDVINYFDGRIYEFRSDKINVQNVKVFARGYNSRLNISDKRVDVDNLIFNEIFDVYAPEPSEVAEILTNEMIENLLKIQYKHKSIGFRFDKGKVYVAIHGLKIMYGDDQGKGDYIPELAIIREEIKVVKDLVEGLGLVNEVQLEQG